MSSSDVAEASGSGSREDPGQESDEERAILGIALGPGVRTTRCACGVEVPLLEARSVIRPDGTVSTRCAECATGSPRRVRDRGESELALATIAPGTPGHRVPGYRARWLRYASACALAASVVLASRLIAYEPSPAVAALAHVVPETAASEVDSETGRVTDRAGTDRAGTDKAGTDEARGEAGMDDEDLGLGVETGRDESADHLGPGAEAVLEPPGPTIEDLLEESGDRLEETFPSLTEWVFPVQGSSETFPLRPSRRFGAQRDGVRRGECHQGHCGVDLGGERGTPIVAVTSGQVSRIQRDEDRASGMYVRIEHPDLSYTYYMHLDTIAADLEIGEEVDAGRVLGTLGSTGVLFSAPHLHFSLEIPDIHSESGQMLYVDPASFLQRALDPDSSR